MALFIMRASQRGIRAAPAPLIGNARRRHPAGSLFMNARAAWLRIGRSPIAPEGGERSFVTKELTASNVSESVSQSEVARPRMARRPQAAPQGSAAPVRTGCPNRDDLRIEFLLD